MMKALRVLAVASIACILAACSAKEDTAAKAVSLETKVVDGAVTNEFFGLTFQAGEDWYLLSDEELRALLNFGEDMATANSDDLSRTIEATRANQVAFFGVFKHPPGTPVDYNPNVIMQAERLVLAPGVKTGADYFFHVKQGLQQTGMGFEFAEEYETRTIGGVTFDQMNVVLTFQGQRINQRYYSAPYREYMVSIIESSMDTSTDVVLESISLDWQ